MYEMVVDRDQENVTSSKLKFHSSNPKNIFSHPLCTTNIHGISLVQLALLASVAYRTETEVTRISNNYMIPAFGNNWTSHITLINTSLFPDPVLKSNLLHFNFDSNVSVYTIRGTKKCN